ncbi:cell envelope integrity protein CreD [Polaromonas sp. JS666]|uniref:cell envelope integrity protein CreD n=1 Tax=Polaromonas sp. (strain JS666 / ATCC BAA-500) TaxID=296591 RepID=UPI0000464E06|nr:cell envelope integrity protein CreD [Polaromonas sp. JS666]ABE42200.1 Inner membrane CreD [Polaromonas sp. JS666]
MKQKFAALALVLILLVLALLKISDVVQDRQNHRQIAIQSVAQSLAGPQTLTGPLIHMACTEEWEVRNSDRQVHSERREFLLVAAPASLTLKGSSKLEPRARGLHATQVFSLKADLVAEWTDTEALKPVAEHAGSRMNCGQPLLMLAVSDSRGIRHASVKVGDQVLALKPGTFYGSYPRGVHAPLPPAMVRFLPLQVQLGLELVGTESISVVPLGGDTRMQLTSNWPHPSFGGQFLPVDRKITPQGFEANWRVSSLASTAQQDVAQKDAARRKGACPSYGDGSAHGSCVEAFSVTFVDPSNTYALSDRATKYGLLFIGLTFLAVGLFEFMKSLRVHPIQYLLVGAAMSMFFLLLVSLSEHMPFESAYVVASAACVLLLTYYASHMLGRWSRGLPFGLGIAMLYGMLFVLLRMEQTALVLGAVALFAVLAAIMMLTRRVDWYARFTQAGHVGQAEAAKVAG